MPRKQSIPSPQTERDFEDVFKRANRRTEKALSSRLAQDSHVLTMGTKFRLKVLFDGKVLRPAKAPVPIDIVDGEQLDYLATLLRPFQLASELIYHKKVVGGFKRLGNHNAQHFAEELEAMWRGCGNNRLYTMVADSTGKSLITGGIGNVRVGDRVLYSEVVHADEPVTELQHIPWEWQQWSLASLVGDWTAVVARQRFLMYRMRPDIVPKVTEWAGDENTVSNRFEWP